MVEEPTELGRELARQDRSNAWLARQLDIGEMNVSRWVRQLEPVPKLRKRQIAAILKVGQRKLFPAEENAEA